MPALPKAISHLEIINIETKARRTIYSSDTLFEAPNWSRDGSYLIFNSQGLLYKLPLSGSPASTSSAPTKIPSGFATRNNNDHGISPDGTQLAICHHSSNLKDEGNAIIYTLPIEGGEPKRITEHGPSYWHGWSPDGEKLAFVGGRPNSKHFNIYSINVDGSNETQLTDTQGLDDGPDYSPCGKYIYFNSYQSGMMQIWRIDSDGSNPTQLVESPHSDWFAHPSPDGKQLVFIRYLNDQKEAHPFGQDVKLMHLNLETNILIDLTEVFYGGQGSLNVPSWSPDSSELAFVSYEEFNHTKP